MITDTTFLKHTVTLLECRQQYGYTLRFKSEPHPKRFHYAMQDRLNSIFGSRRWLRCGEDMSYTDWMMNAVFPQKLYELCNYSLETLNTDARFVEEPSYGSLNFWGSFFGRACRLRPGMSITFLEFLLREGKRSTARLAQPHFYFDIESSAWMLEPMLNNPTAIRSWRTKMACMMAFNFKWNTQASQLQVFLLMRSMSWSHSIGEILGGNALAQAVIRELHLPAAEVIIFTPFAAMDKPVQAKKLLETIQ